MPIIVSNLVGSIRFVSSLDSTLSHTVWYCQYLLILLYRTESKVTKDDIEDFPPIMPFDPFLGDGPDRCNKWLKKNDLSSENRFSNSNWQPVMIFVLPSKSYATVIEFWHIFDISRFRLYAEFGFRLCLNSKMFRNMLVLQTTIRYICRPSFA